MSNEHQDHFRKDTLSRASNAFGKFLSDGGKERLQSELERELDRMPADSSLPAKGWSVANRLARNEMARDVVERHVGGKDNE